jgi:hypothetical protein
MSKMKKRTLFNPATFKLELESRTRSEPPSRLESEQTYLLELFFSGKHDVSDIDFTKFTFDSVEYLIDELFSITTLEDEPSFDEDDDEEGYTYLKSNQGFLVYEIHRIYEASREMLKSKVNHLQPEDDFI